MAKSAIHFEDVESDDGDYKDEADRIYQRSRSPGNLNAEKHFSVGVGKVNSQYDHRIVGGNSNESRQPLVFEQTAEGDDFSGIDNSQFSRSRPSGDETNGAHFIVRGLNGKEQLQILDENAALLKAISKRQLALEEANQKIRNFKEEIYSSDWQLHQDDITNRIWLTDGRRREIFLDGAIKDVTAYSIHFSDDERLAFKITIQMVSGGRKEFLISLSTLEKPTALVSTLEGYGVYLRVKRSKALKSQLFKRLILEKVSATVLIPYRSGWQGEVFCFCSMEGGKQLAQLGFSTPYEQRRLSTKQVNLKEIRQTIQNLILQLGKESAILLLTIGAGGLLYTPLWQKGYRPNVMLTLQGWGNLMKIVRQWLQPWANEKYAEMSNRRALEGALQESTDEVFFLIDSGTAHSLKFSQFLEGLVLNGEIVCGNKFEQIRNIPLLFTERSGAWEKLGVPILKLPFSGSKETYEFDKNLISGFWCYFIEYLNTQRRFWDAQLDSLRISQNGFISYQKVYNWLVAVYKVFFPFFKNMMGDVISEQDFFGFVTAWLQNIDNQDQLDIADQFISELRCMKQNGQIEFVTSGLCDDISANKHIFAADDNFVYIQKGSFSLIVSEVFPGYSDSEVYSVLVKSGYGKGEADHLFPKSPSKVRLDGRRIRMAQIRRSLLLSDTELLMEVV